MKRLMTILSTMLLLLVLIPDNVRADNERVFLRTDAFGGKWADDVLSLEMTRVESETKFEYTFNSGTLKAIYFRFNFVYGNSSHIIGPDGTVDVAIPENGTTEGTTFSVQGNKAYYFTVDKYTNYTITFNMGENTGSGYSNIKISYTKGDYEVPVVDTDAYYFVSPELVTEDNPNGWFKMSPSRVRGGGATLTDRWSFNIQDFCLKDKDGKEYATGTEIHYYIVKGDKSVAYRPYHNGNNNYELGFKNPTTETNAGKIKTYEMYAESKNEGNTSQNMFLLKKGSGVSYTWLLNTADAVEILVNNKYVGRDNIDENGYYLVGNFIKSNNNSNDIIPTETANRRLMTKFLYKGGLAFPEGKGLSDADADSIVYRVTVTRPAGFTSWENLYLAVFSKTDIENWSSNSKDANWAKAIRPQEQWVYGKNNTEGVDAEALHGGLYVRNDGAADTQQAFNPTISDEYSSYTFSMNITTSTYRCTLNTNLYIMGPAVNDGKEEKDDNNITSYGWDITNPNEQSAHAYKLVYDSDNQCYIYCGGDDELNYDNEQTISMTAGKLFAFAYNKNFSATFFEENGEVPVDLSGTTTANQESVAYNVVENPLRYDTQYVNFLEMGSSSKSEYDASQVKAMKFNLPSGEYKIRLYVRVSPINPDESQIYYLIRRAYTFSKPENAQGHVGDYDTYKSFSDYHAVVLPEGIDALYISGSNKADRTVTVEEYPLYETTSGKRVLPAGAAVILATKESKEGTKHVYDLDYYAEPNYGEREHTSKPTTNLLQPQVNSVQVPTGTDSNDNFLFACQKVNASDEKPTIGFFVPGTYNCPINLAYLQLEKDFLNGDTQKGKGWRMVFKDETTGIGSVDNVVRQQTDDFYTLQGIKVSKPAAKGIYIHNGKKVIIK